MLVQAAWSSHKAESYGSGGGADATALREDGKTTVDPEEKPAADVGRRGNLHAVPQQ